MVLKTNRCHIIPFHTVSECAKMSEPAVCDLAQTDCEIGSLSV